MSHSDVAPKPDTRIVDLIDDSYAALDTFGVDAESFVECFPEGPGAFLRYVAVRTLQHETDERAAIVAYLTHHFGDDPSMTPLIALIAAGGHVR